MIFPVLVVRLKCAATAGCASAAGSERERAIAQILADSCYRISKSTAATLQVEQNGGHDTALSITATNAKENSCREQIRDKETGDPACRNT